jgi:hypothetical protein
VQKVKIDIYISDLLYSYDCVIVPNFGGFVANYASAKIQPIQHKLTPPSKQVSFNKNLKTNDGLLTSHIAQRKSIAYEEAKSLIEAFVSQSIDGLNKGDKIHIEKVGTLFLDLEANVQFKAEEKNDFLLDSFGLDNMRVQPIVRESKQEVVERKIQAAIPLIKEEEKKKRKFYWPAAAMLLVLFISTLFFNSKFNWVDTKNVQYSSFGITEIIPTKYDLRISDLEFEPLNLNYKKRVEELEDGYVAYESLYGKSTSIVIDNRSEETILEEDNTEVKLTPLTTRLKFHVMGGCFSNQSNAEGLVRKLNQEGYEARLLGSYKNLHAVSYSSFATREEAITLLAKVRNYDNPDAWLLVKPF